MKLYVQHDEHGFSIWFRMPPAPGQEVDDGDVRLLARLDTTGSGLTESSVGDIVRRMVGMHNAAEGLS